MQVPLTPAPPVRVSFAHRTIKLSGVTGKVPTKAELTMSHGCKGSPHGAGLSAWQMIYQTYELLSGRRSAGAEANWLVVTSLAGESHLVGW